MNEVVLDTFGRIVRQECMPNAQFSQQRQKWFGEFEQRSAMIDGSIHVQSQMADAAQINNRSSRFFCERLIHVIQVLRVRQRKPSRPNTASMKLFTSSR